MKMFQEGGRVGKDSETEASMTVLGPGVRARSWGRSGEARAPRTLMKSRRFGLALLGSGEPLKILEQDSPRIV